MTKNSTIRDRIKELRRVRASELIPHAKNFRIHPEHQRAALRGILAQIGYADALLARETPEGLVLIDGHLRAEVTPDMEVPVLILDVTGCHDSPRQSRRTSWEALNGRVGPVELRSVAKSCDAMRQVACREADVESPQHSARTRFQPLRSGDPITDRQPGGRWA